MRIRNCVIGPQGDKHLQVLLIAYADKSVRAWMILFDAMGLILEESSSVNNVLISLRNMSQGGKKIVL